MSRRDRQQAGGVPDWLLVVLIFGSAFAVFVALLFLSGNPALAIQDTGSFLKLVGITMVIATVLSGLVRKIRGTNTKPDEDDEDADEDDRDTERRRPWERK